MTVALSDLLATPSEEDLRQQFLADLNAAGFPITDWQSGATLKTYVYLQARAYLIALGQVIPDIAAGGYLSEAQGEWLTLLAKQVFNIDRQAATFTVQQATLTCAPGNGPYTVVAGTLVAQTTAGHRYTNLTGGALAAGSPLQLQWQSEGPVDSGSAATSYVDTANSMTTMVTPLLGVTINNPAVDFTPVTISNVASTLVTAGRTDPGVAPTPGSILIKITFGGQVGVATFSYRRIGATTDTDYVSAGLTAATFDIPAIGVRVGFVNGPSIPTFQTGQVFAVSSPGGPVLVQGRDAETAASLVARCMDRFPDLSEVTTDSKYRRWAFAADLNVTKVGIATSALAPNTVLVTIAGQSNPISGDIIANVQAFIDLRTQGTEFAIVTSAATQYIGIGGAVTVPAGTTAAAKVTADAAWQVYVNSVDLGGTVRLQSLAEIVGAAGAIDVSGLAITGANIGAPPTLSAPFVNVKLDQNVVAAILDATSLPSVALTWTEA